MRYVFGGYVLDVDSGELLRGGEAVVLRRQTFSLLQLLIERAPALLSRDTLLDEVWGRTALSPNALPQAISELRRALDDDAQAPQYIQTQYRRGYRFLAAVTCEAESDSDAPAHAQAESAEHPSRVRPRRPQRWRWMAAGFAAVCLTAVAAWAVPRLLDHQIASTNTASTHASRLAIAQLPADDSVPAWLAPTALELFGQHFAGSRLQLVRSDALGLSDRSHGTRWQHQAHDLLGADYAVGGRWRSGSDGGLILDLSVVDLANGSVVASRRIDGTSAKLDAMVGEASAMIAASLRLAPPAGTGGKTTLQDSDGASYAAALVALKQGHASAAATALTKLYDRLGHPAWVEPTLIQAWVQSGDRDAALALLDRRLANSDALPLGERLRLQAQAATLRFQPASAAAALRALVDLYPGDVEAGIQLVRSEIDALQGESAHNSLARITALAATRNDPQLTLLRSRLARLDGDFALAEREAATAQQTAEHYGLPELAVSAALARSAAVSAQGRLDDAAHLLAKADKTWAQRIAPKQLLGLRIRRARLLREQGDIAAAQKILAALASTQTAPLARARVGLESAQTLAELHRPVDADALLQKIHPAIKASSEPDLLIAWLDADAMTAIAANDVDHAGQSFAKAFALARSHGRESEHVGLQVNAGLVLMRQKRYAEADQHWQQALRVFEALGDRRGQATCLGNLAASASSQGKLARSVELNTRALALFRELHLSGPLARTAYNLALAASRAGKLQRAKSYFEEAGAAWRADGHNDFALRAAVGQAGIALVAGDPDGAQRIMAAAPPLADASALSRSHALATLARIALAHGDLTGSRHLHQQALDLRKHAGSKGWVALSELELLRNDLLGGEDAVHVQIASESLARRFAAMGETRDAARAWLLVADAQLSRNKRGDARRSLARVKVAAQAFSDRSLAFDLDWAEAWAGDRAERTLRLRELQHRASEQGYLAQSMRVAQVFNANPASRPVPGTRNLVLPPYARAGIDRKL